MQFKQVDVDSLKAYPQNARTHNEKQVAQIAESIKEFGFLAPCLVDKDNVLIVGHGRLMAAKTLGMKKVPTLRIEHLTPNQVKAYRIADNQLALNAGWDMDLLGLDLTELSDAEFDIDLLGFDAKDLDALIGNKEGLTDPDEVPEEPETPVSKEGDLWLLGNHRLLCGDSTSIDAVDVLMAGQKADMVFTSPPYAQQRDYKKKISDWDELMNGVFSVVPVKDGAQVLVNLGLVHGSGKVNLYWDKWLGFMGDVGWPLFGWYVWDQGHGMPGANQGRLASSHEFIFHFAKTSKQLNKWVGKKAENITTHKTAKFRQKDGSLKPIYSPQASSQPTKIADSVIRVSRTPHESVNVDHPAMYPVELCENIYRSYANAGDIIYEPFSGGGTSIIASDQFGAACYAMELAPIYVDVAVARWENFTGKDAKLETGETFKEKRDAQAH